MSGTLTITRNGTTIYNQPVNANQIGSVCQHFDDPGAGTFTYKITFTPSGNDANGQYPFVTGSFAPLILKTMIGSISK